MNLKIQSKSKIKRYINLSSISLKLEKHNQNIRKNHRKLPSNRITKIHKQAIRKKILNLIFLKELLIWCLIDLNRINPIADQTITVPTTKTEYQHKGSNLEEYHLKLIVVLVLNIYQWQQLRLIVLPWCKVYIIEGTCWTTNSKLDKWKKKSSSAAFSIFTPKK